MSYKDRDILEFSRSFASNYSEYLDCGYSHALNNVFIDDKLMIDECFY